MVQRPVMEKLRRALDADRDPIELREQYNAAVGQKPAAEAVLAAAPTETSLSREELERRRTAGRRCQGVGYSRAGGAQRALLNSWHAADIAKHEQIVEMEIDRWATVGIRTVS
jgi:hypothetical protein